MKEPNWKTLIKEAIEAQKTTMKHVSLEAGLGETYVRDMLQRSAAPTLDKFAKVCAVLNINPSSAFGMQSMSAGTRTLLVKGHVQAGAWQESSVWPEEDWFEISIPEAARGISLHAAQSRGTSMNRTFPEGTIFVYDDIFETGEDPTPGNLYVVERISADGCYETTVKRLQQTESGKLLLMPESNDPEQQTPIEVNGNEGDTVQIKGRVRYHVGIVAKYRTTAFKRSEKRKNPRIPAWAKTVIMRNNQQLSIKLLEDLFSNFNTLIQH